jgi:hypothetical protein
MAGFSSMDDFVNQVTVNGKFWRADWNKNTFGTTAHTAGQWYCLSGGGGNPTANTIFGTGTNLSLQCLGYDAVGAEGIYHGGHVSTGNDPIGYKQILNASAFSAAATTMPAVFMLVDLLGFHPITTVTTTGAQTLINSVTFTAANATDIITHTGYDIEHMSAVQVSNSGGALPAGLSAATTYYTIRQSATTSKLASSYDNAENNIAIDLTSDGTGTNTITVELPRYADGKGVQCFLVPSTVMGAGTPTVTLTYINQLGTTGRTTPTSPALPTLNATAPVTAIPYSGTASGKFGPFLPLASGDGGVRRATAINFSATMTSGVMNLVYCRPLLTLPMTTIGVAAERDLLSQIPSLPRVYDGACLTWLMYAGAATPVNSAFYGHIDFGWS